MNSGIVYDDVRIFDPEQWSEYERQGQPTPNAPNASRHPTNPGVGLKKAPDSKIEQAIQKVYDNSSSDPPNIKELRSPVQDLLHQKGLKASGNQIMNIGGMREFEERRRKPGTRKSGSTKT